MWVKAVVQVAGSMTVVAMAVAMAVAMEVATVVSTVELEEAVLVGMTVGT